MQVGNVIKKVKENFGIDIIIYELAEPEEKSTLASVSKFTYLKQQKKIAHISDELDKIVAELEDEDEDEVEDLGTKYYELSIKGHGGEIQIFRLNKEEAESLRESYEEDEENFLSDNLNGGDFFEEPIIEAVYSVDIFDAELKDENGNEIKISDQQIEINEQIESSDLYENYTLNYYYVTEGKLFGSIRIELENGEKFDPSKLEFNCVEFKLDGYIKKECTLIRDVRYDGNGTELILEDNGQTLERALLGHWLEDGEWDGNVVYGIVRDEYKSNWDGLDEIFNHND